MSVSLYGDSHDRKVRNLQVRLEAYYRSPLHYTTNTPECRPSSPCAMCSNAARLAVQFLYPVIAQQVLDTMLDSVNYQCDHHHLSGDD